MSIQLIDRNDDIGRLKKEDYCVEIVSNNLVVKGIPYVNKDKKILFGTLYCPLTLSGEELLPPADHTVRFMGEHPCDQFGNENNSYVNSAQKNQLSVNIIGDFYFSSKPGSGNYLDYYTKMKRYIELLSAPAKSIDPSVSAQKFDYIEYCDESVFNYPDTNSARAGISVISEGIKNQKIAIVGLGGTGSYVLDFVCKTPVKQISLFDGDELLNHNAFRMPGAINLEELKGRPSKVDHLKQKYSAFRDGIVEHDFFLDESNVSMLEGHDFVFLSIDKPDAKKVIIEYLLNSKIPFVDLGMGISVVDNSLRGTIRKTLVTPDNQKHLDKIALEKSDDNGVYSQNIQIAELNALNAILGVITWKKLYGFYLSEEIYGDTTYILDEEVLSNEA